MPNRYWRGGNGTWNSSNTTNWSSTSGGSGGASVPTSADDVFLDTNSATAAITLSGNNLNCRSLTCTGFTGSLSGSAAVVLSVFGNITFSSGMTTTALGGSIFAINANCNLTVNGQQPNAIFYLPVSGATLTLQDNLTTTGASAQNGLYIANAGSTINCNGKTVTVGIFADVAGGTYALGAATIRVIGQFVLTATTTVNSIAGSTVIMDAGGGTLSDPNLFSPWNKTLDTVRFTNGSFAFSAATDANQPSVVCTTLQVDSSALVYSQSGYLPTWTITNLLMSGVTWGFDFYQPPTLTCTSGTKTANGCSIANSEVNGGATFNAVGSIDGGGNTGWTFSNWTGFDRRVRLTYLRR